MGVYSALVKHVTYPLIQYREGLRGLYGYIQEFERSQWLSRSEIEHIQFDRLCTMLRHAYDHTRYYRKVMDGLGTVPTDFRDPSDIARLPILTKEIIRENFNELMASNIPEDAVHFSETGGTTGVKMRFCRDNACLSPKAAATIRHERWTGWDIGKPRGLVWPAEQDYVGYRTWKARLRNALGSRQSVLPAAVLNDQKIHRYLDQMKKRRPAVVRGFSTPLYLVARYALKVGDETCHTPAVLSTGEPLFEHQRRAMEQAFGAEVFDSYGAREVGLIAQECPAHRGMHINAESVYVEAVETEVPDQSKILVTDLVNFGMPFIRYEIGDMGSLSARSCPCGRGLPLMEMGGGREADVMFAPNGNVVAAVTLVLYLVDNGPVVGQVQVVQDALDHLLIRVTKDPPPGDGLFDHYEREVANLFGEEMGVTFELVDSIPNEPSGKYRFAICAIPERDRPAGFRAVAGSGPDE